MSVRLAFERAEADSGRKGQTGGEGGNPGDNPDDDFPDEDQSVRT